MWTTRLELNLLLANLWLKVSSNTRVPNDCDKLHFFTIHCSNIRRMKLKTRCFGDRQKANFWNCWSPIWFDFLCSLERQLTDFACSLERQLTDFGPLFTFNYKTKQNNQNNGMRHTITWLTMTWPTVLIRTRHLNQFSSKQLEKKVS